MTCYNPLTAWQSPQVGLEKRPLHWSKSPGYTEIQIPCGQCIGCRLERSRQWALRCVHEASMYDENCFLTLTYDDDHLPHNMSLDKRVVQLFIKRVRKYCACDNNKCIKFYLCGEYGEVCRRCGLSRLKCVCARDAGECFLPGLGRPHYHVCLFNFDFKDKYFWRYSPGSSEELFRSPVLERMWAYGFSSIGLLTFKSAAYVSRYCTKKVIGVRKESHYDGRMPEFGQMSLRPGLGVVWWSKYKNDVQSIDKVIIGKGLICSVPRYYDKIAEREDQGEFLKRKERRKRLYNPREDCRSRLLVKEQVKLNRVKPLQRAYENGYTENFRSS